jgi:hypothetical protein
MSSAQRNLATCLLVWGGLLAIVSQATQAGLLVVNQRTPVVTLFLMLGLVFFLLGVTVARSGQASQRLTEALETPGKRLGVEAWQVAAMVLALLFSILTHYAAGDMEKMYVPAAAWAAWLAAIFMCILGMWNWGDTNLFSKGRIFAFALGFSILALPFRAIATGQIPIVLNGDEASAGIHAIAFLKGEINNPFTVGWYAFPNLYFYIPAASISMLGNTTEALRIPSAIAGALTVGGTYLAGHVMFGRRAGWIAALALTGFHFHIHFSRIGLNNIWDGFFFVLTVLAAWYAWERENRNAYILAGLGLGLSQYFYPSSRAILVVVFGGIFLSGLFDRAKLKRSLINVGLMAITTVLVFLPLAWYYIKYPEQYVAPLNRVGILGEWMETEMQITGLPMWRILLKQIILGVQAFTYLHLEHWYRPEVALLRPIYAGLFLLGLVFLVSRPRDSRSITMFLWLGMFVLLGGLSESTPAAQRYVAAAPVCMLLIAHGLNESGNLLEKLWGLSAQWMTMILVGVSVLIAASDANFYFNRYTPFSVKQFGGNDTVIANAIANDLTDKPEGTQVFFFTNGMMGYYSIPTIPYLVPQVEGIDVREWESEDPDVPKPVSKYLVFIFRPENMEDLPVIQTEFPGGDLLERKAYNGETMYFLYYYQADP